MPLIISHRVILLLCAIATATSAHAHPGHDVVPVVYDFPAGFIHAFRGWDHALAALAAGFWAVCIGGHARWLIPSGFISGMIAGIICSQVEMAVPAIEQGVAASLLGLGMLIANVQKAPIILGAVLMGGFAVFHGASHGPFLNVNHGLPTFGIIAATMSLHLMGLFVAQVILPRCASAKNCAGWAIAAAGVFAFAM